MIQFYFLSIVLNALAGYILVFGDDDVLEFKSGFSLKDEIFKFVIGILAALVGILKLLSVIEGDVPVIGDLLPAAANFLSGFVLVFEYYRSRSSAVVSLSEEGTVPGKIGTILGYKKIIGIVALIASALHFLFPKVLLL
jgi:hypothetical protein